jgi:2-polyprenyl-6-methoxyphenol hydroxylase-like FAD-dependent oxidoreductase
MSHCPREAVGVIKARGRERQVERGSNVLAAHGSTQLPGHDVRETRDGDGELISRYNWKTEQSTLRMFMMLRRRVIEALERAAVRNGVEILTSSEVDDVTAEGAVSVKSSAGSRKADFIIVADGAGSRGKIHQMLLKRHVRFSDGTIRLLLPRTDAQPWSSGTFVEYWSGQRRAMLTPCSESHLYMGLIARENDRHGIQIPLDTQSWIRYFPVLEPYIHSIGEQERWSWDQYQSVILRRRHQGKVALIGDAAHAMSPNFGQGAALAMVSAVALSLAVSESADLSGALTRWESMERPLIDRTQWLSGLYSSLMSWPDFLRSPALAMMGRSRWIMRQRTLAAYRTPTGYHASAVGRADIC